MAIVKMKKFTLLTMSESREPLIKEFQRLENIHFRDLRTLDDTSIEKFEGFSMQRESSFYESELAKISFLLGKLKPFAKLPSGLDALKAETKQLSFDDFDSYVSKNYTEIYEHIKGVETQIQTFTQDINQMEVENESLKEWISFDTDTTHINAMKSTHLFFGTVNRQAYDHLKESIENEFPSVYIENLGITSDSVALAILIHRSIEKDVLLSLRTLGFISSSQVFRDLPRNMLHKNQEMIVSYRKEIEKLSLSIEEYGDNYEDLLIIKESLETAFARTNIINNFKKSQQTIIMEGWFPEFDEEDVKKTIKNVCQDVYYLDVEEVPKENMEVPVKLKNNKFVKPFEQIVNMFSTPLYSEIDPTGVMVPFYMVSFGFMVGDFGYGLIMFLILGALFLFFNLKEKQKNFLSLFFILSFAVMFAGLIYGSFFGHSFFLVLKTPEGIPRAIIDSDYDVLQMLVYSVVFGFIQGIFGLIVKGYMLIRDRDYFGALFDSLCWIISIVSAAGLLVGVIGVFPPELSNQVFNISKWVFIISVIGLALTQGRQNPTLIGKIGGGLYEVYGLANFVGDFISYTRVAALALSGAYIGFSFNEIIGLIPSGTNIATAVIFFLCKALIFVAGHSLNLGLALLGAYVHTSRLQYVEYFGKFFEGGGVPYAPLTYKNSTVNVTNDVS